jgi:hypothetical protein
MRNRERLLALIASIFVVSPAWGQVLGFVDDFSAPGTNGWISSASNTNPGTGGVGGVGDGYLNVEQSNEFNFGTHNDGPDYAGNWTAAGITHVSFYLNDVNTDEDFSFHFLVTGDESNPSGESTWQYNTGFQPPNGSWQQYVVDLTSGANWTQTRGSASFADVLADVADAHFRHDLPPFFTSPDPIMGDIGIDNIALVPEPSTIMLLASVGLAGMRRRRRAGK